MFGGRALSLSERAPPKKVWQAHLNFTDVLAAIFSIAVGVCRALNIIVVDGWVFGRNLRAVDAAESPLANRCPDAESHRIGRVGGKDAIVNCVAGSNVEAEVPKRTVGVFGAIVFNIIGELAGLL